LSTDAVVAEGAAALSGHFGLMAQLHLPDGLKELLDHQAGVVTRAQDTG
jgi:hypothetical protein